MDYSISEAIKWKNKKLHCYFFNDKESEYVLFLDGFTNKEINKLGTEIIKFAFKRQLTEPLKNIAKLKMTQDL